MEKEGEERERERTGTGGEREKEREERGRRGRRRDALVPSEQLQFLRNRKGERSLAQFLIPPFSF